MGLTDYQHLHLDRAVFTLFSYYRWIYECSSTWRSPEMQRKCQGLTPWGLKMYDNGQTPGYSQVPQTKTVAHLAHPRIPVSLAHRSTSQISLKFDLLWQFQDLGNDPIWTNSLYRTSLQNKLGIVFNHGISRFLFKIFFLPLKFSRPSHLSRYQTWYF